MAFDNTIVLVGNVTRDPELRFTPGGAAVATFGLAWNHRTTNRQTNESEEQVNFFDVTCWRQLAENVAESVTKGMRVVVYGRLQHALGERPVSAAQCDVVAAEIAPSLKFATAQITKNDFRGGDGERSGGGGGGGGGRPVANEPVYDPDEEPF